MTALADDADADAIWRALLVDHCGRPTIEAGLDQAGFRALLELGAMKRAFVKLSGFAKFSREPAQHRDVWPFLVEALVGAFHARSLSVGVGLAVFARADAHRLRRAASAGGCDATQRSRSAQAPVGHASCAVRICVTISACGNPRCKKRLRDVSAVRTDDRPTARHGGKDRAFALCESQDGAMQIRYPRHLHNKKTARNRGPS
jgi:hypothetical protein